MPLKTAVRLLAISLFLIIAGLVTTAIAQNPQAKSQVLPRIVSPVDDSVRISIPGSTHPLAQRRYDIGRMAGDTRLERMVLLLDAGSDEEQQIQDFLDRQQVKGSADYHHWLTPEEFGQKFGPHPQDIQQVTNWLHRHGLSVNSIANSGRWIEFSGTAQRVETAFQTQMRQFQIAGNIHSANATAISIPAALSPVVRGVVSLHNFFKKPMLSHVGQVHRNEQGQLELVHPNVTVTTNNGTSHFLAPGDYAKIYDLNAALNGQNQTIAIVARSNINISDIRQFRQTFKLSPTANDPVVTLNGPDPGVDTLFGDGIEATLDTEWSGAVAPAATINVVVSGSTLITDGVDLSSMFIVDNNLAPIMSVSFGQCEQFLGTTENAFFNSLWQQAAAQGISVFVSAGDDGNAGCDDPNPNPSPASNGSAVSGIASTPFNTAVGGTEFNEGTQTSTFWNSSNSPLDFSSAVGYIPEMVWNESCIPGQLNTDCAGQNFFELFAGSGGVSTLYNQPTWQIGITGIPAGVKRELPDVSLTAAGGHDGYLICFMTGDPNNDLTCSASTDNSGNPILQNAGVVGGTSASSPSFAGIMAGIDQNLGRQGLANYILYQLAKTENFTCTSDSRTNPLVQSTCAFNDIITGSNNVPGQAGFMAAAGFDQTSGLGSVDAKILAKNWTTKVAGFQGSKTMLTSAPASINITHGQSVMLTATVQAVSGSTVPTGNVAFMNCPGSAQVVTVGAGSLSGGTFSGSFNTLPGGSYNLCAHYPGDGVFGPSDSTAIPVTVGKENTSVTVQPSVINLTTGAITSGGNTVPYGDGNLILVFDATVAGASGAGFPSGNVIFVDTSGPIGSIGLNNRAQGEVASCFSPLSCLTVGVHSIIGSYPVGDNSFNPSGPNTAVPIAITITKGNPVPALTAPATIGGGTAFTAKAVISTGLGTIIPTGTVQFLDGATALGNPVAVTGGLASAQITLNAGGAHNITAQYSGDNTYNSATSAPSAVNVPFGLSASTSSQSIAAGGTATYTATLTGFGGFSGQINLACTGAPGGATCTVSPSTATLSTTTTSVPLTVTVSNTANARLTPHSLRGMPFVLAGVFAAGCFGLRRKQRQRLLLFMGILLIGGIVSCGGGGGGSNQRGPTNATLTVTGTSGSTTSTLSLSLIVTH